MFQKRQLQELIAKGKLHLQEYSEDESYKNMIHNHIKDRLVRFDVLGRPNSDVYKFCRDKFGEIIEEIQKNN